MTHTNEFIGINEKVMDVCKECGHKALSNTMATKDGECLCKTCWDTYFNKMDGPTGEDYSRCLQELITALKPSKEEPHE
jgi:recombinational DNA repair protein (RecF pathway)